MDDEKVTSADMGPGVEPAKPRLLEEVEMADDIKAKVSQFLGAIDGLNVQIEQLLVGYLIGKGKDPNKYTLKRVGHDFKLEEK